MLGARGAALGLGRLKLTDLRALDAAKFRRAQANSIHSKLMEKNKRKARVVIRKTVDKQTLWAACRATIFGLILISIGAAMATVGYFANDFAAEQRLEGNLTLVSINQATKFQFVSLSYIGPCIMGVGAFLLMIACVMTLESRDKHARVVHKYSIDSAAANEADDQALCATGRLTARPIPTISTDRPVGSRVPTDHSSADATALNAQSANRARTGKSNPSLARDESQTTVTGYLSTPSTELTRLTTFGGTTTIGEVLQSPELYHSDSFLNELSKLAIDPNLVFRTFVNEKTKLDAANQPARCSKPVLRKANQAAADAADISNSCCRKQSMPSDRRHCFEMCAAAAARRSTVAEVHKCWDAAAADSTHSLDVIKDDATVYDSIQTNSPSVTSYQSASSVLINQDCNANIAYSQPNFQISTYFPVNLTNSNL